MDLAIAGKCALVTGASRFAGVGSGGPLISFSRSTICTTPDLFVP